ncbi:MAG: c-type cytochrome [Anaerolineales bacterium]
MAIAGDSSAGPIHAPVEERKAIAGLLLAAFIATACQLSLPGTPTAAEPVKPTSTPVPASSSTPEFLLQGTGPDRAAEGRMVYLRTCAVCHGPDGEGYANELAAPALNASEHASEHPDPQIHDWIVNGKLGLGRQMPAYADQLSDAEVHAVIAYLHTLWTPEQLKVQQDLGFRWPATLEPTWTPRP